MNLTGLRMRSIGVGVGHSMGLAVAFGLSLTACGPQFSEESAALKSDGAVAQTYQEWCTDWQLNCPPSEPGKTDQLTAAQYKALTTIASSALASPSMVTITRQELNAPALKQAMTALHLDDLYQDLQTRLDSSQFQTGGLESGSVVLHSSLAYSVKADSGVVLNLDTIEKISVAPGAIGVSGVGLSADAQSASALQSIQLGTDGSFSFAMTDRTVSQIPQDFALDHLLVAFGIDVGKLEGKEIGMPDIIAAGGPLLGWLNQPSRQVVLNRDFFSTAAPQLGVLVPADDLGKNLGNLLNTFESVRTSADAAKNLAAVSLIKGATAKCDMNNGDVKIKFASEFGVKRWYQVNPTTLGIELYGLDVAAKKALGISIKLKRVELSADKLTVLDVPVIGKVELKWDEVAKPDQKMTLVCGA